jgi:hypothetical protein
VDVVGSIPIARSSLDKGFSLFDLLLFTLPYAHPSLEKSLSPLYGLINDEFRGFKQGFIKSNYRGLWDLKTLGVYLTFPPSLLWLGFVMRD